MKKLKLLVSSSIISLAFTIFQTTYAADEENHKDRIHKSSPSISVNLAAAKVDKRALSFDELQAHVEANMKACSHSIGQDITVFIGNKGSGKSTFANIAAKVPLELDGKGGLRLKNQEMNEEQYALMGTGGDAVTLSIKYLNDATHGHIYDIPGWNDTRGSAYSLINLLAIRQLITKAGGVRIIIVANRDELIADRGEAIKKANRVLSMFEDKLLKGNSCSLIVNRISAQYYNTEDHGRQELINKVQEMSEENNCHIGKVKSKRVYPIIEAPNKCDEEANKLWNQQISTVETIFRKSKPKKVTSLNKLSNEKEIKTLMKLHLDQDYKHELDTFIGDLEKPMQGSETPESSPRILSAKITAERNQMRDKFKKRLEATRTYQYYSPHFEAPKEKAEKYMKKFEKKMNNLIKRLEKEEENERLKLELEACTKKIDTMEISDERYKADRQAELEMKRMEIEAKDREEQRRIEARDRRAERRIEAADRQAERRLATGKLISDTLGEISSSMLRVGTSMMPMAVMMQQAHQAPSTQATISPWNAPTTHETTVPSAQEDGGIQ